MASIGVLSELATASPSTPRIGLYQVVSINNKIETFKAPFDKWSKPYLGTSLNGFVISTQFFGRITERITTWITEEFPEHENASIEIKGFVISEGVPDAETIDKHLIPIKTQKEETMVTLAHAMWACLLFECVYDAKKAMKEISDWIGRLVRREWQCWPEEYSGEQPSEEMLCEFLHTVPDNWKYEVSFHLITRAGNFYGPYREFYMLALNCTYNWDYYHEIDLRRP